jgi:hypothetical protein
MDAVDRAVGQRACWAWWLGVAAVVVVVVLVVSGAVLTVRCIGRGVQPAPLTPETPPPSTPQLTQQLDAWLALVIPHGVEGHVGAAALAWGGVQQAGQGSRGESGVQREVCSVCVPRRPRHNPPRRAPH